MKLKIREARLSKEMTINELAKKAGVSKSFISDLENGKSKNISLLKLCKISKALDTDVTELFTCEDE